MVMEMDWQGRRLASALHIGPSYHAPAQKLVSIDAIHPQVVTIHDSKYHIITVICLIFLLSFFSPVAIPTNATFRYLLGRLRPNTTASGTDASTPSNPAHLFHTISTTPPPFFFNKQTSPPSLNLLLSVPNSDIWYPVPSHSPSCHHDVSCQNDSIDQNSNPFPSRLLEAITSWHVPSSRPRPQVLAAPCKPSPRHHTPCSALFTPDHPPLSAVARCYDPGSSWPRGGPKRRGSLSLPTNDQRIPPVTLLFFLACLLANEQTITDNLLPDHQETLRSKLCYTYSDVLIAKPSPITTPVTSSHGGTGDPRRGPSTPNMLRYT